MKNEGSASVQPLRRAAIAWVAAAIGIAAAMPVPAQAAAIEVPPLADIAPGERHSGKVVWYELVTTDLAGAKRFYAGMFGWSFRDLHGGDLDYSVALLGDRPVAGLIQRSVMAGERRQPAWLTFIAVNDLEAARRSALAQGARILMEPRSLPRRGRQAVFADPEGAVFAVLASDAGDPADFLPAPGEWIWSALLVREPVKDAGFYQSLFGYELYTLPSKDGLDHLIFATDDLARASVNALPRTAPPDHPHWLSFVRVVDARAMAARAVTLGGHTLVAPHLDRHGGWTAVVADPAGAPVGLMEWSESDSEEDAQ